VQFMFVLKVRLFYKWVQVEGHMRHITQIW